MDTQLAAVAILAIVAITVIVIVSLITRSPLKMAIGYKPDGQGAKVKIASGEDDRR